MSKPSKPRKPVPRVFLVQRLDVVEDDQYSFRFTVNLQKPSPDEELGMVIRGCMEGIKNYSLLVREMIYRAKEEGFTDYDIIKEIRAALAEVEASITSTGVDLPSARIPATPSGKAN